MGITDELKKKMDNSIVKEISFHDLVGDMLTYKPRAVRRGRSIIENDDPYFRVIDAGHDLLMTSKRNRKLVGNLPKELQSMVLELEAIMKEITLSAVEDDFDYRSKLNRYYFQMIRVNYLGSVMSYRMNRFLESSTEARKYLGTLSENKTPLYIKEMRAFVEIGREMMLASNLFMNNLEEDYTMEEQLLQQRELSNDRALQMM